MQSQDKQHSLDINCQPFTPKSISDKFDLDGIKI